MVRVAASAHFFYLCYQFFFFVYPFSWLYIKKFIRTEDGKNDVVLDQWSLKCFENNKLLLKLLTSCITWFKKSLKFLQNDNFILRLLASGKFGKLFCQNTRPWNEKYPSSEWPQFVPCQFGRVRWRDPIPPTYTWPCQGRRSCDRSSGRKSETTPRMLSSGTPFENLLISLA